MDFEFSVGQAGGVTVGLPPVVVSLQAFNVKMKERTMAEKTSKQPAASEPERNPDPITNAPGAHPIGVGIGAAAGGAAAGAVAGAVAGPVGAAVGAVVGAVAGGYAGKGVAESIDPTIEEAYWRDNYRTRAYYDPSIEYEELGPAYRYGWESKLRYQGRRFDEAESDLERGWSNAQSTSRLSWQKAKQASRDAWERVERAIPGDVDNDGK
jgi:uncharacterized protein YcfJ